MNYMPKHILFQLAFAWQAQDKEAIVFYNQLLRKELAKQGIDMK